MSINGVMVHKGFVTQCVYYLLEANGLIPNTVDSDIHASPPPWEGAVRMAVDMVAVVVAVSPHPAGVVAKVKALPVDTEILSLMILGEQRDALADFP